jgi:serine/threonine protein kinase
VDSGEDGSGPFLVMERIPLPRLEAGCTEKVVPLVFRALATVHEARDEKGALGVVHGDLSPSNVLADESGACLIDFGLATFRDLEPVHSASFSGTLRYAAPERARGEAFGQPADVFSMAMSVLHALTGVERDAPSQAALLMMAAEAPTELLARARPLVSATIHDRLSECCAMDPRARPSAKDVFP